MISKRWEALKKNPKELKVTFPTYYKSWNFQISIQPFALITKSVNTLVIEAYSHPVVFIYFNYF